MDWKNRQQYEQGVQHGIAVAMLAAGLDRLDIDDSKTALWSYTHRMRVTISEPTFRTYHIEKREPAGRE